MTSDKAREDVHYVHFQFLLTMENQGDVKSAWLSGLLFRI